MDEQEKKIIARAKKTLMAYLSMTEPQAHRFLEKQAMNLRVKKMTVAKAVLKMYPD